jgi:hypothetical protein
MPIREDYDPAANGETTPPAGSAVADALSELIARRAARTAGLPALAPLDTAGARRVGDMFRHLRSQGVEPV